MKQLVPVYNTLYDTLQSTWPMITLFVVIMVIFRISRIINNHEKFVFYRELYNLLFIIYLLLLYYLLLSTDNASSGLNLTPFKEITRYQLFSTQFFYNVIGNDSLIEYANKRLESICKKNKIKLVNIESLNNYIIEGVYPTNDGYEYITNQILQFTK